MENQPNNSGESDPAVTNPEHTHEDDAEVEAKRATNDVSTGETTSSPDEKYCQQCGSAINHQAVICPECGVEQNTPNSSSSSSGDDQGVAVLLSALGFFVPLFAGAGQMYNGEIAKGVVLTVVQIINVFLVFIVIGIFTYPIVAAYSMYDAYHGAE